MFLQHGGIPLGSFDLFIQTYDKVAEVQVYAHSASADARKTRSIYYKVCPKLTDAASEYIKLDHV